MRALLFLLAACGRFDFEPQTDSALPPAGPRLKLQYNAFDDGTREVIGAYDTLLQTACAATPMATTAGYGCLPIGAFVYFSDAACTQPVMQVSDCNPDTHYAYDPFVFPVAHVYTPGADIVPTMLFQRGAEGACIASGTPTGAYKALTEVPLDTFVPLTRELGGGGRVQAQTYVAPDGFRLPGDLFDTQANGPCIAQPYDDMTVCSPYSAGIAYFYTDATCTHLVYDSNVAVDFGLELQTEPYCKSTDVRIHASLGAIQPSQVWVEIPGSGTCAMTAPEPGWIIEDLGPPITPAAITRMPVGSSRIQLLQDASGAATSTEYDAFDTQFDVECQPAVAADGVLRCLPRYISVSQPLFSDAGCTQPVALVAYGPTTCTTPLPPLFIADYESQLCGSHEHIYNAGAKYTGAIYTGTPTSCSTYTPSGDMYRVGTEVPPAMFSTVTVQNDP